MASAMDLTTDLILSDSQGEGERERWSERRGEERTGEERRGERPDLGQRGGMDGSFRV